jgi:hypothetical protein
MNRPAASQRLPEIDYQSNSAAISITRTDGSADGPTMVRTIHVRGAEAGSIAV